MTDQMTSAQSAQAAPYTVIRLDASALLKMAKEAPGIIDAEIRRALEEIGSAFERIGAEEAPEGALGGSGGLRGSVFHELRGTPIRTLIAGWGAPYADVVSRGRRPGKWPPRGPIELWVRKVLNVPEKRIASATFLVQRKIGTRGTRGSAFVERTLSRLEPLAQRALDAAAERAAERMNE